MTQPALFEAEPAVDAGAIFSPCGRYRWLLWRKWGTGGRIIVFAGLNPSIADAKRLDPTCTRFEIRAKAAGFDGFQVVNAFAAVSTDPKGLLRISDPVGPLNDGFILDAARSSAMFVCCWGSASSLIAARARRVTAMLAAAVIPMHAVHVNQDGQPAHLLYQKLEHLPFPWSPK